jgi:hypothetical protein
MRIPAAAAIMLPSRTTRRFSTRSILASRRWISALVVAFETLDLGFEALNVGPRRDIVMNHIEPLAYESRVARQCRA